MGSKLFVPRRLEKGDTIGIISPSAGITRELKPQFYRGVKFLKNLGFKVLLGKNALRVTDFSAGSPEEKAADINSMFSNERVKAIISSQGGAAANSVLPLLDWSTIRQNPKIFLGISDITILLNAIYLKTGLVTFHGDDVVWGFGRKPSNFTVQEFLDRLMHGKIGSVTRRSEWRTVREGKVRGRLFGGNLGVLSLSAGTPYFPDLTDAILFLEAYQVTPGQCAAFFYQMKQAGVFDTIKGVITGYVYGLQHTRKKQIQMEDVLAKVTDEYDFPILKVNEFGHECPNTVIPIGSVASVDAGAKEWKILDRCVE
jgi:muramoyltetrapeptide carboxypeptidase